MDSTTHSLAIHCVLFALISLLSASLACTRDGTNGRAPAAPIPWVSAELVGPPEPVFDTRDACEETDIPDEFPHAFRDADDRVHLIASHSVARAMIGPNLDHLKRGLPGDLPFPARPRSSALPRRRLVDILLHRRWTQDRGPGTQRIPRLRTSGYVRRSPKSQSHG
jgi:hypothetical protein